MEIVHLPFSIERYGGFAKLDGIVTAGSEHLALEYRTYLFGAWSGEITKLTIGYRDLQAAEYRAGFFSPKLLLTARSLAVLGDFPTCAPAQIRLGVRWKDRARARALAAEIHLTLSYHAADRLRHRVEDT
jgi:hypothetical protein